jgi:hypothetical protein
MSATQATPRIPNKFNEIFSTANNFLGPARAENPFVDRTKAEELSNGQDPAQEETSTVTSDRQ